MSLAFVTERKLELPWITKPKLGAELCHIPFSVEGGVLLPELVWMCVWNMRPVGV
jgi:hypothetical protein